MLPIVKVSVKFVAGSPASGIGTAFESALYLKLYPAGAAILGVAVKLVEVAPYWNVNDGFYSTLRRIS